MFENAGPVRLAGSGRVQIFFAARPCRNTAATNPSRQTEQAQNPASSVRGQPGTTLLFVASAWEGGVAEAALLASRQHPHALAFLPVPAPALLVLPAPAVPVFATAPLTIPSASQTTA